MYEIADAQNTSVGDLTGTRRRYSVIRLPERIAQAFGLSEDDRDIKIEHYDEGLSAREVQYTRAFWELRHEEEERRK